jgi:exosortase A-associated hydrolase 2
VIFLEKHFFFNSGGHRLFGFLHSSQEDHSSRGVIICPPFAEEKQDSHRVLVNFARELARKCFGVLRFDYFGTGDSEGDWEEATVSDWLSDIRAAIDWVATNLEITTLGLIGLRIGGTFAALAAESNDRVKFLILWNPVINLKAHFYQILRSNLTTQMRVHGKVLYNRDHLLSQLKNGDIINLDGYSLTKGCYESAVAVNLLKDVNAFQGDSLIISFPSARSTTKEDLPALHLRYQERNPHSTLKRVPVHPFWQEPLKDYRDCARELFDATIGWLRSLERT